MGKNEDLLEFFTEISQIEEPSQDALDRAIIDTSAFVRGYAPKDLEELDILVATYYNVRANAMSLHRKAYMRAIAKYGHPFIKFRFSKIEGREPTIYQVMCPITRVMHAKGVTHVPVLVHPQFRYLLNRAYRSRLGKAPQVTLVFAHQSGVGCTVKRHMLLSELDTVPADVISGSHLDALWGEFQNTWVEEARNRPILEPEPDCPEVRLLLTAQLLLGRLNHTKRYGGSVTDHLERWAMSLQPKVYEYVRSNDNSMQRLTDNLTWVNDLPGMYMVPVTDYDDVRAQHIGALVEVGIPPRELLSKHNQMKPVQETENV